MYSVYGKKGKTVQPRSQGSLLPALRSVGRVGENPGNEVENSDAIKEVRSKGRDVYPLDRQILL